jgi:hypothetical protein
VTVFESREEREAAGRPVDPKWMQEQNVSSKFPEEYLDSICLQ